MNVKHKKKDGRMGMIDAAELPPGYGAARTIAGAESLTWAATGDFRDLAKNHCAAVAVTNLALYFSSRGYDGLMPGYRTPEGRRETFREVHQRVGNGPVFSIARKAKRFFRRRGVPLRVARANTLSEIEQAIDRDRPVAIQISDGLLSWHWVLCVGTLRDFRGGVYLRVVSGWHRTIDKYYKPFTGSAWILGRQYWVPSDGEDAP